MPKLVSSGEDVSERYPRFVPPSAQGAAPRLIASGIGHEAARALSTARGSSHGSSSEQGGASTLPLLLVQEIPLGAPLSGDVDGNGGKPRGRLDHFTADPSRKLVYLACLGENRVDAVNVFTGRVSHSITSKHMQDPQGVL